MTPGVGRVHVRCSAPETDEARAFELRDRLVRTARTHLPDALDQAFAQGKTDRRIFADRVAVELDFDPEEYDDVTIAVLWAVRVRRSLDAELDTSSPTTSAVTVFEDDRAYFGSATLTYALSGELSWIYEELACGSGRPTPRAFLASFDSRERVTSMAVALERRPDAAAALWARLAPPERRAVFEWLMGRRRWGDVDDVAQPIVRHTVESTTGGSIRASQGVDLEPAAHAPTDPRAQGPASNGHRRSHTERVGGVVPALEDFLAAVTLCARTDGADVRLPGERRVVSEVVRDALDEPPMPARDAVSRVARPGDTDRAEEHDPDERASVDRSPAADEGVTEAADAWWSRAGGLVLLYPWVADLLADDVEPGQELAHRLWALAAVASRVDPGALLSDPLVRALAGDDPGTHSRPAERPGEWESLAERADGVIRSFAACLSGFEASTPDYLRRYLLDRGALVARIAAGGFAVRLEPAPLDPVLARLPYPLASFRFAWSEPISVELRDARA